MSLQISLYLARILADTIVVLRPIPGSSCSPQRQEVWASRRRALAPALSTALISDLLAISLNLNRKHILKPRRMRPRRSWSEERIKNGWAVAVVVVTGFALAKATADGI